MMKINVDINPLAATRKPVLFASWLWASDVCFVSCSVLACVLAFKSMEEVGIVMTQVGCDAKSIEMFLSPVPMSW